MANRVVEHPAFSKCPVVSAFPAATERKLSWLGIVVLGKLHFQDVAVGMDRPVGVTETRPFLVDIPRLDLRPR